jgi:hypothetical protein
VQQRSRVACTVPAWLPDSRMMRSLVVCAATELRVTVWAVCSLAQCPLHKGRNSGRAHRPLIVTAMSMMLAGLALWGRTPPLRCVLSVYAVQGACCCGHVLVSRGRTAGQSGRQGDPSLAKWAQLTQQHSGGGDNGSHSAA